jgi:hypothetical protein
MPIVIDGSAGTVTGISAGGLPDNSITNAEMADNAIGLAELSATGTASATTFLRGDNSWAAAGGGKIVKVWLSDHAVAGSTDSTSYVKTTGYIDVTPSSASNKILIMTHYNMHFRNHSDNETNSYFRVKLVRTEAFDDTTSPTDLRENQGGIWESGFPNGAEYQLGMGSMIHMDSPNTTSNRRYAIYYKVADSDWTLYMSYNTTAHDLIAYEIADVAAG